MTKPFDELEAHAITFVGEQDGPAEQKLKDALTAVLRRDSTVTGAWLARAVCDGTPGVILGLATTAQDSEELVEHIGVAFASIFNTRAHLDVMFLSANQQTAIDKVCPAFYRQPPH